MEKTFKNPKNYSLHFIGIGGIGMSGIAEVLHNQGYPVSGSDLSENETTKKLKSLGINVFFGHHESNITDQKVIVISSAIKSDNPELVKAKKLRIPVLRRAEMLGELMRGKTGLAIAGTHGKTTTTSLMASILTEAESDSTIIIGGKVDALGGNAKYGKGSLVLAEADESDGSFSHLPATFSVITNIDADHLDYFSNQDAIDEAFINFVGQIPFYGKAICCGDDSGIQRCLPKFSRPTITYGFQDKNDYVLFQFEELPGKIQFKLRDLKGTETNLITVPLQGKHNALNAAATFVLAIQLGIEEKCIITALSKFGGVKRRFDLRYKDSNIEIRDDYGHHPTEIRATLEAAKGYWKKGRIIIAFQPHRHSRTFHFLKDFSECFHGIDTLFLTDIYAAGEEPYPGIDSNHLLKLIQKNEHQPKHSYYTKDLETTSHSISSYLKPGDLLITMGAGNITKLPDLIEIELKKKIN